MDDRELIQALRNHAADLDRTARPIEDLVPDAGEPPGRPRRELLAPILVFLRRSRVALAAAAIVVLAFIPVLLFEGSGDEADVADGPIETSAPTAPPTTAPLPDATTTTEAVAAEVPTFVVRGALVEGSTSVPFEPVDLTLPDGSNKAGVAETDADGDFFFALDEAWPSLRGGDDFVIVAGHTDTPFTFVETDIRKIHAATDTVVGWVEGAPDLAPITVTVRDGDLSASLDLRVDGGWWVAEFGGVFDVTTTTTAELVFEQGRFTWTRVLEEPREPQLVYLVQDEAIYADGFGPLTAADITVDGETVATATFDRYGRLDRQLIPLEAGSVLGLSDGSLNLDLEIYDGTVEVDAAGRVMRGVTSLPDGSVISVQLFDPTGRELFQAEPVVEDGGWSARIPDAVPETFFDSSYSVGWWGDGVSITFAYTWR
jgi:hypothetical protein